MTSETASQKLNKHRVYAFSGGVLLGALLASIPFWFAQVALSGPYVMAAIALMLLCGTLTAWLGWRFVELMMQMMSDSGL